MSAWQDILSLENWEIITGVRPVINDQGKEVYIKAEMPTDNDVNYKTYIKNISDLIKSYHAICKTDLTYFENRISVLNKIQLLTKQYMENRGEAFQHKKGKKLDPVLDDQSIGTASLQSDTNNFSPRGGMSRRTATDSPKSALRANSPRTNSPRTEEVSSITSSKKTDASSITADSPIRAASLQSNVGTAINVSPRGASRRTITDSPKSASVQKSGTPTSSRRSTTTHSPRTNSPRTEEVSSITSSKKTDASSITTDSPIRAASLQSNVGTAINVSPRGASRRTAIDSPNSASVQKPGTPTSSRRSPTAIDSPNSAVSKPTTPRRTNESSITISSKTSVITSANTKSNADVSALLEYESVGLGHMDQWVESLHKRIDKKIKHLEMLKNAPEAKYTHEDIKSKIKKRHKDGRLFSGVFLEKDDTYHRQFEFNPDQIRSKDFKSSNPMDRALNEWLRIKDDKKIPFFVWLEKHPITTSHNKFDPSYEKVSVIDYNLEDAYIVTIVKEQNLLMAKREHSKNEKSPLTTKNLIQGKYKDCRKLYFNQNATAYAWNPKNKNELVFVTHPHKAKQYHHSSLVKGENVGCAGLWEVEGGKVKYIDNSSGHYRNSSLRLYQLVKFLDECGVLNNETTICDLSVKESIGNMNLQDYYKWAKNNILELKTASNQVISPSRK